MKTKISPPKLERETTQEEVHIRGKEILPKNKEAHVRGCVAGDALGLFW